MQRVSRAAVRVDGAVTGEIGRGLAGYARAAPPEIAQGLYRQFVTRVGETGLGVAEGVFRATMEVELVNDGPVTLLLDSKGEL